MDLQRLQAAVGRTWDESIIERLVAYVRIPNKSPMFDPQWERHGHMEAAVTLMAEWCRGQPLPGARVEVRRLPGRTPLLLIDVPGELPGCVLLYGHLDKQPEFTGWLAGLGPWEPVIRDGRLYGRGAADDGYAVFSSLTAIAALKEQRVRLPRCVVLIEACEESGSDDLPAHLEALGAALGEPSLVVCLDAECGNYRQVWCTTSLRGNLVGTLRVRVLTEGVHSGMATGIAPTPFRILEQLLARIESPVTGDLLLDELQATLPRDRRAQAAAAARVLGEEVAGKLPWAPGVQPLSNDPTELIINSTWRATLAVTGADGLPATGSAGNVLLPELAVKLSLRLPPTCDAARVTEAVREALEREPPYGAQVTFESGSATGGWNAPPLAPWLEESISRASRAIYGQDAVHTGCGGTIPFMGMLGERFPRTQFFITGVLGPHSNAHGPNEFLDIEYAKQLTVCVSLVLADHARTVSSAPGSPGN
ncbi:MAG TPA: M20/M25/M40 family metallo-hydrolase [Steroidobacteraceae bacterium]|jgi:acetylornithine deacetylase/succinyl-diaminopimelate desuccinylase-like protein|nr:M20/M25/M40 family metallo-hydrolase [Steroidobacteraceae bacterium]